MSILPLRRLYIERQNQPEMLTFVSTEEVVALFKMYSLNDLPSVCRSILIISLFNQLLRKYESTALVELGCGFLLIFGHLDAQSTPGPRFSYSIIGVLEVTFSPNHKCVSHILTSS